MITAKNGHMCLNCGYAESADPHKIPLVPADSLAPVVAEVKPPIEAAPTPKEEIEKPEELPKSAANSLEDQVKHDIVEAVDAVEKSAVTAEPLAAEPTPLEVVPEPAAAAVVASDIIKTTGRSKVQAKKVDSMAPQGRTKGTLDLKPSREDLVKGAASVSAVDAIGPALATPDKVVDEAVPEAVVGTVEVEPAIKVETEPVAEVETEPSAPVPTVEPEPVKTEEAPAPVADATPAHVIDHAAEAKEAAVTPAEPAVAIASAAPAPTPAKEPLLAMTHPEGSSSKKVIMIVGGLVIVTCATLAAYYFTSSSSAKKVGQNANVSKETSAAGAGESAATLDKTATPSPSAAATPNASSAQARDLKRKADLAAYAAAVKAAATNGYYPTAAPGISGAVVDPTTGKSYAVATTPAANLGTIQYLAGGKCNAPSVTPGKTSTRYIALSTKLETDSAPYCLDVQ